jgi:hypothetical protein
MAKSSSLHPLLTDRTDGSTNTLPDLSAEFKRALYRISRVTPDEHIMFAIERVLQIGSHRKRELEHWYYWLSTEFCIFELGVLQLAQLSSVRDCFNRIFYCLRKDKLFNLHPQFQFTGPSYENGFEAMSALSHCILTMTRLIELLYKHLNAVIFPLLSDFLNDHESPLLDAISKEGDHLYRLTEYTISCYGKH